MSSASTTLLFCPPDRLRIGCRARCPVIPQQPGTRGNDTKNWAGIKITQRFRDAIIPNSMLVGWVSAAARFCDSGFLFTIA